MAFQAPGESLARPQISYWDCCRDREHLQLLTRMTFINTINMNVSQRTAKLGMGLMLECRS